MNLICFFSRHTMFIISATKIRIILRYIVFYCDKSSFLVTIRLSVCLIDKVYHHFYHYVFLFRLALCNHQREGIAFVSRLRWLLLNGSTNDLYQLS
nr:hypothetical protein [uncultured Prevotella sp.]